MRTRQEHLEWCKSRALVYVDAGDLTNAYTSLVADLNKHPETANHTSIQLSLRMLWMGGLLNTPEQMREFINGFN